MQGKLIVFEGTDGSGKATQTELLCQALEKQGITSFLTAEVQMIPQNTVAVEGENLEAIQKMLELLDDYDDVQEVFHNAELPEEEEEE